MSQSRGGCRRLREKTPRGVARKSLPSESSKGTVTSNSPAASMHVAPRDPICAESLSLPQACSLEWAPKISAVTQRVANQYKACAVACVCVPGVCLSCS